MRYNPHHGNHAGAELRDAHVYLVAFYRCSGLFPDAEGARQYLFPVQRGVHIQKAEATCLARCAFAAVRIANNVPQQLVTAANTAKAAAVADEFCKNVCPARLVEPFHVETAVLCAGEKNRIVPSQVAGACKVVEIDDGVPIKGIEIGKV